MKNQLSRRSFLMGGAAAVGAAAGQALIPNLAQAAPGGQLTTVLDLKKCIGCEECVGACREKWQSSVPDPADPIPKMYPSRVPVEDWSQKKDVQDRLTPYNFLYVEMLEFEYKGETRELYIPRRCMHCTNPPCTNLCPFGAGRVESNGIVHIDEDICLGGAKCKKVCPWHIPQRQSGVGIYLDILPSLAGNGAMFKCHRCRSLVKEGETPRCIEVCPEKVQSIGPRDQQIQAAIALAKKRAKEDGRSESDYGDYIYGLVENGGTNTLYVSPIPFDQVNKAVMAEHKRIAKEEGPQKRKSNRGRPHMGRVANSMENEENLAWALLLAPVAGVAAGVGKLYSGVKKAAGQKGQDGPGSKGGEA